LPQLAWLEVSAVVALAPDDVDEDVALDESVPASVVAAVAAQRDDVALESAIVVSVVSEPVWTVSVGGAVVVAALSTVCTAIAPPRPRSAATLAAPAARRARRAGCARLR
jgi:hypothetical protein